MNFANLKKLHWMLLAVGIALFLFGDRSHVQAQVSWPVAVDLQVPMPPTPVKANGQAHLLYELHITNFDIKPLELTRIEILGDDASASPLASYEDAELEGLLARPGTADDLANKRLIDAGLRAVVYIQLSLDASDPLPRVLSHRLTFKAGDEDEASDETGDEVSEEGVVEGARIPMHPSRQLVIGPPLQGEGWIALNGLSNASGHRRALIVVNGAARIPQRFATDWALIGEDGQVFHDDPALNENWYGYGAEAIAVDNAVVVDVKDGIPENVPLSGEMAVTITLETVGGNYVLLDLGNHRYAWYAHLQPQSIRVKVGDRVRQGEVLGLVGNSGNSDAPHLHFHITDDSSPMASEGIPYALASFDLQGFVESLDVFENGEGWQPDPNATVETIHRELPVENAVVNFP